MVSRTVNIVLFILIIVDVICGVEFGCRNWEAKGDKEVCCTECHTGNRRVHSCGFDPKALCRPCPNGTFTKTESPMSCDRCNQCVDPQVTHTLCYGTTDTICGCKKGYQCYPSDPPKCEQCQKECGQGEEPVRGTCRKCSNGTFNNKIHAQCIPWTSVCKTGYDLVTNGTSTTDNMCVEIIGTKSLVPKLSITVKVPSPKTIGDPGGQHMSMVWISMGFLGFSVLLIVIIVALFSHQIKINKPLTKMPVTELPKKTSPPAEPRSLMPVEQEECSFCQPQQEQGSSMESLPSQDSMEKLLPLV